MNGAAVFTVVLSGIPQHDPRYNLESLAKYLKKALNTAKIEALLVRESRDEVAIDFNSMWNAKLAQQKLDKKTFTLEDGIERQIRARIIGTDLCKSDEARLPAERVGKCSSSEESITDYNILKKVDKNIEKKLKLMRMKKDALIKERKKIMSLLGQKKGSAHDESDEDLCHKKKKKSKKSKKNRKKSSSSSSDSSSESDNSDQSKRKRRRRNSSSSPKTSPKTPDLRNRLQRLRDLNKREELEYRDRRGRSPSIRRLSSDSKYHRQMSPHRRYSSRETEREYRRDRPRSSRDADGDRYWRHRAGSSKDSWAPRRRRMSRSRSRSRSRETRYRRSRSRSRVSRYRRSRSREHWRDWPSDSKYNSRLASPRPGLMAIAQDAYRPNISEEYANKMTKTPKPRDNLYSESILVKKKSPIKKEVYAVKQELDMKIMKEAIKEIVFDLSGPLEELCVVHDTSPDDRKRVLTELLETILTRFELVSTYPGISVAALVMRYRCHSSKQEDKECLEKIFLSVLSTRQIEWKASKIQNNDLNEIDNILDGLPSFDLNEIDDILDGLPSFMEDVKPKIETIEIDKEEGELDDDDDVDIVSVTDKDSLKHSPTSRNRSKRQHSAESMSCRTRNYSAGSAEYNKQDSVQPMNDNTDSAEPIQDHLELFTMNDPPYKVHITMNRKRSSRFYLTIKRLLKRLKPEMLKHQNHIEVELFLYIGRLILEKRILNILGDKTTKYTTPEILTMYTEAYPIEEDEKFVIETLCDIWRGQYNDDVYVDVIPEAYSKKVKRLISMTSETTVKQEIAEIKKEIDTDEQTKDTLEENADIEVKKEKVDIPISIKQEKAPDFVPQTEERETTPTIKSENLTNDKQTIKQEITNDPQPILKEKDGPLIAKVKIENDPGADKKETEIAAVKEPNNCTKPEESKVEKVTNTGEQEVKKETVVISDDEEECTIIEDAEKIVIEDDDDVTDDVKMSLPNDEEIVIDDSGDEGKVSQDYDSDSTVILQVKTESQNDEIIENKDVEPKHQEEIQANNKCDTKSNEESHEDPTNSSVGNHETTDGDKATEKVNHIIQGVKDRVQSKDILNEFKNIDIEESVEKIQEFLQQGM